jgi:hypothetical protein
VNVSVVLRLSYLGVVVGLLMHIDALCQQDQSSHVTNAWNKGEIDAID